MELGGIEKTDGRITIYPSSMKLILVLVGSVAMVCVAVLILVFARGATDAILGIRGFIPFSAILAIAFFTLTGGLAGYTLVLRKPALVIDQNGLTDNASGVAAGFLAWPEIDRVERYAFAGHTFLGLYLKDVNTVRARLTPMKSRAIKSNIGLGAAPINLPASLPGMTMRDLEMMVNDYLNRYGTMGTPAPSGSTPDPDWDPDAEPEV